MLARTAASLAVCVVGTLGFASAAQAATAALVEFAIGNPSAIDAAGSSRALAKGAAVQAGDTIDTGTGRVQLRFSDGAYVSLQPGSQFRIDEYNYNGKNDETERGFFSLIKGGLRTITGLVGRTNRRNYQVHVPVATIGIRGTEYTLLFDGKALGSVGEGEIAVCNSGGCLNVGSGQAYVVADANTRPELTSAQSFLAPPPPPSTVGRHSGEQPGNGADPNSDFASVFISGDNVTANGLPASLPGLTAAIDTNQPLFGDQIGNSGPPVTNQDVALLLTTQNFPADYQRAERNTFGGNTTANVQGGRLISWEDSVVVTDTPTSTIGTAAIADRGNVGQIAWGRFNGGTLGNGSAPGSTPGSFAGKVLTGTDSLHYVVAKPTPVDNLPFNVTTGTATLNFNTPVGATTPTTSGTPTGINGTAQLLAATLVASFTPGQAQVTAHVSLQGSDAKQANFTGLTTVINSNLFGGGGSATGSACPSGCDGDFSGVFAGPQAQYAGFTYSVRRATFGDVRGAVVVRKNP